MRLLALALLLVPQLRADPCGMVPPIHVGNQPVPTLERTGTQRTYVMHHGGVETMALRPGFVGTVEHFGMLIPFPTPPEIRKIDDDTFAHLEGMVDPPKINVYIQDPRTLYSSRSMRGDASQPMSKAEDEGIADLGYREVKVLREEAVGMYQVAVLQAGGAGALQTWMEDNGYRYPDGMDEVVNEYVASRWCFVAVKAKVGGAEGVTPRPGMRSVNPDRPAGSTFDGAVQGMAFRFATKAPVVPMRLSVFNGEDPRNVVYLLADQPMKVDDVPESLVVRQLPGAVVHQNLTQPLELLFHNGTLEDIQQHDLGRLNSGRNPSPYVRVARDLIAGDLLAVRTNTLSLEHEEQEKELLRISESFGLRGEAVDDLHDAVVAKARATAVDGALDDLKEMHLTVLDGVFPQEVLARQNLAFSPWRMPKGTNPARSDELSPADLSMYFTKL